MSLAFSVLYIFGPRATLSSFMPARQGIFVRDTLGLVLGKCCKVNKLTSVFHASVLLLIINFVITLSK